MRALLSFVVLGVLTLMLIGGSSVALLGCSGGGNGGGGGGGAGGTGGGAGGGAQNQGITVVDATSTERLPLAMAIGPNDRVGIAYFVKIGLSATRSVPPNDAGFDPGGASDYDLRYVEWQGGTASAFQKIITVQRPFGVSLTFQSNGEPVVTYLGGGDDQSIYWFQSDAVVNTRSGSTWTENTIITRGDQVPCGDATCATTSDRGFLVGVTPSVIFTQNTLHVLWRDGHDGQFPQQDWAGSDLESARGAPNNWQTAMVAAGGVGGAGGAKPGWGGHAQLAIGAGGNPVAVSDFVVGSPDGFGKGVAFHRWGGSSWSTAIVIPEAQATNNQTGPSLAYRQQTGYGVAFVNRNTDALQFISSANGINWSVPDVLFQNGSGGWYPSLAFDPVVDEPTIAFYVCSLATGVAEGSCPASQDDLRVALRGGGGEWSETVIDTEGGYLPKLGFLSTNKRVIAYRHPTNFQVKLYVEP